MRRLFQVALFTAGSIGAFVLAVESKQTIGWSTLALPALIGLIVAAVGCAVLGWYVHQLNGATEAIGLLAIVAAASALLAVGVWSAHRRGERLVRDYCSYGAVSKAQLEGCRDHVSAHRIFDRDTRAARFAREGVDAACLSDAGRFCEQVLRRRMAEEFSRP